MKRNITQILFTYTIPIVCTALLLTGCEKEDTALPDQESHAEISDREKEDIFLAGFSPEGVVKTDGGYRIEGDIFMTASQIAYQKELMHKTITGGPVAEQYSSPFKVDVGNTARTLKIKVDAGSQQTYFYDSTADAIARFNELGLVLDFVLLDAGSTETPDILIKGRQFEDSRTLGQSYGFPDEDGNPAPQIDLSIDHYTAQADRDDFVTTIAHEIGHAIGFRHTDLHDRSLSCGQYISPWDALILRLRYGIDNPYDESELSPDEIPYHITGTPTGADPQTDPSWMLACSDGTNRPFTPNDLIAIKYLYPEQ
ncbi:M57 family metalloprotease [Sinomicrobium oceani]|uniref:M57 family metalloprotease n=1 Tax=Sinomicrobium oceani TaxID=1150368 RepID=UPI00227B3EDC|nr:M57 family metalloprotease [Sinomicrobium oceani]